MVTTALLMSAGAIAEQTVPGEKWRQTITVQMAGMSMPMGTHEICAPVGKAEALLQPDKNCVASDVKVTGNTLTAHISCTGKDAMEGTIEETVQGDRATGRIRAKTKDGDEISMTMESQKMGTCQAMDTAAVAAKVTQQAQQARAAAPAMMNACGAYSAAVKKDARTAGPMAKMFLEGECATKPANADFCAALQTRPGFTSFAQAEAAARGVTERSVTACGFGAGPAGVDALRVSLLKSAEADGEFIIAQAPARAKELARSECVLRGEMWMGKTTKWDTFCDSNFAEAARKSK